MPNRVNVAAQHAATIGAPKPSITDPPMEGVMPLAPGFLGGKSLADTLGELLSAPNAGKDFPKVMRLTSYNPDTQAAVLHDPKTFTPFETGLSDLKKLISSGDVQPAGNVMTDGMSVEQLLKKLSSVMRRAPQQP